MCGVFGFVGYAGRRPNLERLRAIARATERRGPHAFGFAWIDARGRLRRYKQTGRISDHLGLLAMAGDARMLIGHCRYATHGDPGDNTNNHPHACDGGWIVHNGTIPSYAELLAYRDLEPTTACDSEALALLIEAGDGTLVDRCASAVDAIDADRPAVLLGLWSRPARLIAIRRGNPLRIGTAANGMYLASLADAMPRDTRVMPDDTLRAFRRDTHGAIHVSEETIETQDEAETHGRAADIPAGCDVRVRAVSRYADAACAPPRVRRGCWFE